MNVFPYIQRGPSHSFSDEPSAKAVLVASTASGYPLLVKQFTFDPRMFSFELRSVLNSDKLTIMAFYEANKDVPFYWLNKQDGIQYEVVFISIPRCRMEGRKDLWKIALNFLQSAP